MICWLQAFLLLVYYLCKTNTSSSIVDVINIGYNLSNKLLISKD